MVKKLIKYEMQSYVRTLLPMVLILLGIGLLTRFVQFFEADTFAYSIIEVSSIVALVISVIVCLVMTVVVSVSRFYKNLFTGEGYLSFTLPVTPTQHILTKLLVAVIFVFISVLAVILSLTIASAGELLVEIVKAISFLADQYFDTLGIHGVFYLFEMLIILILVLSTSFLLFYGCIAVGQMAKKNRILAAFGVYFGYYFACQILGTIFVILISSYYYLIPFDTIAEFANNHPYASAHILLCAIMLYYLIPAVLYFFVTRLVINKRLNLE